MNNELIVLENKNFGKVRTVWQDDKIWFVASDIATALGYVNPQKAVRDHCKHAKLLKQHETFTLGIDCGPRGIFIIPEGDVYRLITRSKLPDAIKFELWLFDEALPKFLNNGTKQTEPELTMVNLCRQFLQTYEHKCMLEQKVDKLEYKLETLDAEKQQLLVETGKHPDFHRVMEDTQIVKIIHSAVWGVVGNTLSKLSKTNNLPTHIIHHRYEHRKSVLSYHKKAYEIFYNEYLDDPKYLAKWRLIDD